MAPPISGDEGRNRGTGGDPTSLRWVAILVLLLLGLAGAGWVIYRVFVFLSGVFGRYDEAG